LLTHLRHPHLVQVLAVGETDTKAPFMVLERLTGENLDARLERGGPLHWLEVVDQMSQVASAIAALHRVGVIHRDVKPGNIVAVKGATDRPFVKLIDLGGAKVEDWQCSTTRRCAGTMTCWYCRARACAGCETTQKAWASS
jgi:serine/threonine protein kinase